MNRRIQTQRFTCLLVGLALMAPLAAQHVLYVQEPDDKFHAVFNVHERRPSIMENGKLVAAKGQRFALKEVEEYLPLFIAIHDKEIRPTNAMVSYSDTPINNGFHFSAKFESADSLTDVFLVLDFTIPNVGKKIFAFEIGQLDARTPKSFATEIALGQYMGSGPVVTHLFVGGTEVFSSEQSTELREEILDRMIAKRIAGVQQASPKPLYGSAPAYPAALSRAGLKGEAVVTVRIGAQGAVLDAGVARASEPAFGEEALAAVRLWRFVPRVQEGRAVETKVSIPFEFDPPKIAADGKG